MRFVPLNLKDANDFVKQHHRHNRPTSGHKFSIGLEDDGVLVGVGIAGRPVARYMDDGHTLELRRVCVRGGFPNGCSQLMGRLKRIGQLMGYDRIITYTLQRESGASLRAVAAKCVAGTRPSTWAHRPGCGPHQAVYDEPKYRWELQDEERSAAVA